MLWYDLIATTLKLKGIFISSNILQRLVLGTMSKAFLNSMKLLDHVVIDVKGLMSKEQCVVIVYLWIMYCP
jgi:hypothetical protein